MDTEGCILPGESYGDIKNPVTGQMEFGVTYSRQFVQEINNYLNQFQNNRIIVEGNP